MSWIDEASTGPKCRTLEREFGSAVRAYFRGRWPRGERSAQIDAAEQATWKAFAGELAAGRIEHEAPFRFGLERAARSVGQRFESEADPIEATGAESDVAARDAAARHALEHALALALANEARHMQAVSSVMEQHFRRGRGVARGYRLLELQFSHGLSLEEIARLWKVPLSSVLRVQDAARKDYMERLREATARCFFTAPEAAALERECDFVLETLARPAPVATWAPPDSPWDPDEAP